MSKFNIHNTALYMFTFVGKIASHQNAPFLRTRLLRDTYFWCEDPRADQVRASSGMLVPRLPEARRYKGSCASRVGRGGEGPLLDDDRFKSPGERRVSSSESGRCVSSSFRERESELACMLAFAKNELEEEERRRRKARAAPHLTARVPYSALRMSSVAILRLGRSLVCAPAVLLWRLRLDPASRPSKSPQKPLKKKKRRASRRARAAAASVSATCLEEKVGSNLHTYT